MRWKTSREWNEIKATSEREKEDEKCMLYNSQLTRVHTRVKSERKDTKAESKQAKTLEAITSLSLWIWLFLMHSLIFPHDLDYFAMQLTVFFLSFLFSIHSLSSVVYLYSLNDSHSNTNLIDKFNKLDYVCMQMFIKPSVTLNSWSFIVAVPFQLKCRFDADGNINRCL